MVEAIRSSSGSTRPKVSWDWRILSFHEAFGNGEYLNSVFIFIFNIYMSVCLSIYLSISISLSVCVFVSFIYLIILYLYLYLFAYTYLYIYITYKVVPQFGIAKLVASITQISRGSMESMDTSNWLLNFINKQT